MPCGYYLSETISIAVFCLFFLLQARSFVPQQKVVASPARIHEVFCRETNRLRCWDLERLSGNSNALTQLRDSLQQDYEIPVHVNGDSDSFFSESTNLNGAPNTISNGNSNGQARSDINGKTSSMPDNVKTMDVPMPTKNGGYTHTEASRAKIGAANKGKTPWNKGKQRSEEVKARIAAGVRARNREKFLQKLKDMGLTEEEYEAQKKEERRKKEAERRARRTENGGYRPTKETRAKISKVLKEKHARGEIKRGKVDPSKVRRGFVHTDETKKKISEALKKRWANDSTYREHMTDKMKTAYKNKDVRKKVSDTLKKKWQDPEFREQMVAKIQSRKKSSGMSDEYREKLSLAMKEKWKDASYREKTLRGIAKHNGSASRTPRPAKKSKAKQVIRKSESKLPEVQAMKPLVPGETTKKTRKAKKARAKRSVAKKSVVQLESDASSTPVNEIGSEKKKPKTPKKKAVPKSKRKEPDGSVNRLREERRDLFDLLYGDDEETDGKEEESDMLPPQKASVFDLDDEDLDSFDPYGLDDY